MNLPGIEELYRKKNGIASLSTDAMAQLIKDRYDTFVDYAQEDFRRWRMNVLFARSIQWGVMDTATNRIVVPRPPRGKIRLTINMLKPWLLDTEAKYNIDYPTFEVEPNTSYQEDKDAAVAGERTGDHYWHWLKIKKKMRVTTRYNLHFGGSFWELDWDDTVGPKVQVNTDVLDPDGQPATDIRVLGDVTLDVRLPHQVFTDELPGEFDVKPYVGIVSWMSLDDIVNNWEKGHLVQASKVYGPMHDAVEAMHVSGMRQTDARDRNPGAPVFKMLFRPQRMCEYGMIVVTDGKVELDRYVWPEQFAKLEGYPVVPFTWYTHPLQSRGPAPLEDQIPLQRELNITASQVIENKNLMSSLKILNPIGSNVRKINDLAGQIINHTPNLAPSYMQPPSLPAYVFKHREDIIEYLEDIQMRHQPSRGRVPPGVKSGVGMNFLTEQDDRPLSIPEADAHDSLSIAFRKILQIVSVGVSSERMIRFVGPGRRRQTAAFKGADLRGNTNINVKVVSGQLKSRAGTQQMFLELVRAGAFKDAKGGVDIPRMMDVWRFSFPDIIWSKEDQDEELQMDEMDMLDDPSQPYPMVQRWHNHPAHLKVLESKMNTLSWVQKANKDQMMYGKYYRHWSEHLEMWAGTGGQPQQEPGQRVAPSSGQPVGQGAIGGNNAR